LAVFFEFVTKNKVFADPSRFSSILVFGVFRSFRGRIVDLFGLIHPKRPLSAYESVFGRF